MLPIGIVTRNRNPPLARPTTLRDNSSNWGVKRMRLAALASGFLILFGIQSIWAQERSEPSKTLIEMWGDANSRCRGGSGDSPTTDAACAERERISARLGTEGRCYGKRGQSGAEMRWHICASDSIGANANCVVADPTSTPLNVRTSPNGKIISTVLNGERTRILDQATDQTGSAWAYISDEASQPLGWVYRRYVVCR